MNNFRNTLFLILGLLIIPSTSFSLDLYPAAPYTVEAANRLAEATDKISPPVIREKAVHADEKKEQAIKLAYEYYKTWFNKAGYSFDKSVIQLAKDFEQNPDIIENNPLLMSTAFMVTYQAANQFAEINKQFRFSNKILPNATLGALLSFAKIMDEKQKLSEEKKKQEEAKRQRDEEERKKKNEEEERLREEKRKQVEMARLKQEEELRKKQEEEARLAAERKRQEELLAEQEKANRKRTLLEKISGHYENDQKDKGALEIQLISENQINFSGYNKITSQCKFEDKVVNIMNYDDYKGIITMFFEEGNRNKGSDEECKLDMKFGKYSEDIRSKKGKEYFIEIDMTNKCRSYCEKGGIMIGRYSK